MGIGARIKERRLALNMSDELFRTEMELKDGMVQRLEASEKIDNAEYVQKLADVLLCEPEYLTGAKRECVGRDDTASRVKRLRYAKNLTKKELRDTTNISPYIMNNIEGGKGIPKDKVTSLAMALGCSEEYLLGLDDVPVREEDAEVDLSEDGQFEKLMGESAGQEEETPEAEAAADQPEEKPEEPEPEEAQSAEEPAAQEKETQPESAPVKEHEQEEKPAETDKEEKGNTVMPDNTPSEDRTAALVSLAKNARETSISKIAALEKEMDQILASLATAAENVITKEEQDVLSKYGKLTDDQKEWFMRSLDMFLGLGGKK